jgi:pantoate--beta-alanine ligase
MVILKSTAELKVWRDSRQEPVGFVPTMGALHEGHLQLVQRCLNDELACVVSIFVNPTQFNDPNDLMKYPRTLEQDLEQLQRLHVQAVFLPEAQEIYADNFRYVVTETADSKVLCGLSRPGHFDGVLTVVLKLLNLVRAKKAYFGEKDFQQLRLIQGMALAFYIATEIVPCPTVREADGLAMSSRNMRLNSVERELAPALPHILQTARDCGQARAQLEQLGFRVDYVEEHWGRRFVAAFLGEVRLIDNVEI